MIHYHATSAERAAYLGRSNHPFTFGAGPLCGAAASPTQLGETPKWAQVTCPQCLADHAAHQAGLELIDLMGLRLTRAGTTITAHGSLSPAELARAVARITAQQAIDAAPSE